MHYATFDKIYFYIRVLCDVNVICRYKTESIALSGDSSGAMI